MGELALDPTGLRVESFATRGPSTRPRAPGQGGLVTVGCLVALGESNNCGWETYDRFCVELSDDCTPTRPPIR